MHITLLAEIGDKEPSVAALWAIGFTLELLCYFLTGLTRWVTLVTLPLALFWFVAGTGDVQSIEWRNALIRELGEDYISHIYVTSSLPFLGVVGGWFIPLRLFRSRQGSRENPSMA